MAVQRRLGVDAGGVLHGAQVAASKRFRGYKKEDPKRSSEITVDNPVIGKLEQLWIAFGEKTIVHMKYHDFGQLAGEMRLLGISVHDVEAFSLYLEELLPQAKPKINFSPLNTMDEKVSWKAGFFLSAMVEAAEGEDFTLHVSHLPFELDYLGYRNRKNILVLGDTGKHLAQNMQEGMICVSGDAGDDIGFMMEGGQVIIIGNSEDDAGHDMRGGTILIEGDAGSRAGNQMRGGNIVIMGDVDPNLAQWLCGGEIHVEGSLATEEKLEYLRSFSCDASQVDEVFGGRVFHRGRLIVDKKDLDEETAKEMINEALRKIDAEDN
jgi:hypothetical protein